MKRKFAISKSHRNCLLLVSIMARLSLRYQPLSDIFKFRLTRHLEVDIGNPTGAASMEQPRKESLTVYRDITTNSNSMYGNVEV
jgi:hypothetical protein